MDRIRIGYFLEDLGQENFLRTLIERISCKTGLASERLSHDVRNATGGHGTVLSELKSFLRDVSRARQRPFDVLVVAIDGNCQGYTERRREILEKVAQTDYAGSVVCAVPDPHVERWYLADPDALRQVLDTDVVPEVPPYKCERGRYKQALRDAIHQAGEIAPLGGLEYGSAVAKTLDMYDVGKADPGFKHFCDELLEGLEPFVRG